MKTILLLVALSLVGCGDPPPKWDPVSPWTHPEHRGVEFDGPQYSGLPCDDMPLEPEPPIIYAERQGPRSSGAVMFIYLVPYYAAREDSFGYACVLYDCSAHLEGAVSSTSPHIEYPETHRWCAEWLDRVSVAEKASASS